MHVYTLTVHPCVVDTLAESRYSHVFAFTVICSNIYFVFMVVAGESRSSESLTLLWPLVAIVVVVDDDDGVVIMMMMMMMMAMMMTIMMTTTMMVVVSRIVRVRVCTWKQWRLTGQNVIRPKTIKKQRRDTRAFVNGSGVMRAKVEPPGGGRAHQTLPGYAVVIH